MPRRSSILALLALPLAILLAGGCASSSADSSTALSQKRDEAIRLAVRGKAAYDKGELANSIEHYKKSIETFGEIPGVRTNLGVALLDHNELLQAADTLKAEVQLFPGESEQALTNLGVIYADKGWAKEALEYFNRALEQAPRDPVALRGAIEAMINTNADENETLKLVKRAQLVERNPKIQEHYKWLQIGLETTIKDRPRYGNTRNSSPYTAPPVATPTAQPDAAPTTPTTPPANTDPKLPPPNKL